MAYTKNKVKYSEADIILLGLLPESGEPISSVELAEKYYSKKPPRPRTAMQSISKMMSSLIEDVFLNKEPFIIVKAKRSGPNPMEYRRVGK